MARLRALESGYLSREDMAGDRNAMSINNQFHIQMQSIQREKNRVLNAKHYSQQKHRC
jgi:hypothetical protein